MRLSLTGAEQRQLAVLSDVLLSPLAARDGAAWREQVDGALRGAFGCDHVMFVTSEDGKAVFRSPSIDSGVLRCFAELTTPDPRTGLFASRDPVVETWFQARRADRLEVFTEAVNDRLLQGFGHDMRRSEIANNVWRGGMLDFFGLMTECTGSEMMLITGFERRGRARRSEEAIRQLLHLVLPAFRSGHQAWMAHAARRQALGELLDSLEDAVLLVDASGREQHRNGALGRLLAGDPEAEQVIAAGRRLAAGFRPPQGRGVIVPATHAIETRGARYAMRAMRAPVAMVDGDGAVLLTITTTRTAGWSDDALRHQFGLTRREVEVARQLACGLSNTELATALGVSHYTARNHTERVLAKLGVASRARVGAVLRGEGARLH